MNGWSPGTIARFGSFLFWSFGLDKDTQPGREMNRRAAYPWVRNAARLYQYNLLQKLDCCILHSSLRVRRPHELYDPGFHARERIPLRPFVPIRTSAEVGKTSASGTPNYTQSERESRNAQSTKEKWVHAREGLHGDFDGPSVGIVQKGSQYVQRLRRN